MKLLTVHYCGWGEDWPLGRLADDGQSLLFEYSSEALSQGLELSPLHLKLRADAYGGFPTHLHRLPGLIADSLLTQTIRRRRIRCFLAGGGCSAA